MSVPGLVTPPFTLPQFMRWNVLPWCDGSIIRQAAGTSKAVTLPGTLQLTSGAAAANKGIEVGENFNINVDPFTDPATGNDWSGVWNHLRAYMIVSANASPAGDACAGIQANSFEVLPPWPNPGAGPCLQLRANMALGRWEVCSVDGTSTNPNVITPLVGVPAPAVGDGHLLHLVFNAQAAPLASPQGQFYAYLDGKLGASGTMSFGGGTNQRMSCFVNSGSNALGQIIAQFTNVVHAFQASA